MYEECEEVVLQWVLKKKIKILGNRKKGNGEGAKHMSLMSSKD